MATRLLKLPGLKTSDIAFFADDVGPSVRVDVGDVIAVRDLDGGERRGALMLADDGDDVVARDQLLDRGAGFLRKSLRVFENELDLWPVHAAGVIDDLGGDFDAVLHLRALRDRAGGRLRDRDADLDRIGGECGVGKSKHTCGKRQQTDAMRTRDGFTAHNSTLLTEMNVFAQFGMANYARTLNEQPWDGESLWHQKPHPAMILALAACKFRFSVNTGIDLAQSA